MKQFIKKVEISLPLLVTFLFFYLFIIKALIFASTINLENGKNKLDDINDEYNVDITLSINTVDNTQYFLRGVFYKPGKTDYCGYTWNGNSWFKGPYSSNDGWKNFLPVTISDNSWKGQLKAKIDPEDSGCQDSGTYNFKIQRFTFSGSSTFDSQNILTLDIIMPTPTSTPVPTNTKTPTQKPTPTLKPTHTPKPTPTSKIESISKQTSASSTKKQTEIEVSDQRNNNSSSFIKQSGKNKIDYSNGSESSSILGDKVIGTSAADTANSVNKISPTNVVKTLGSFKSNLSKIFILFGIAFLIVCSILIFRSYKRLKKTKIDDQI